MRTAILFAVAFLLCAVVQGATINVPADYPTIQAGINAAVNGDTVLVAPGTFHETIVITKQIKVVSEEGAELTVIDAGMDGSVVLFFMGTSSDCLLEGFTLTNGFNRWNEKANLLAQYL